VPAAAETHRGIAQRLVVSPAHFEGGVVVRAADRFFVVDPGPIGNRELAERRAMRRFPAASREFQQR
jgi:hypothetical protein